MNRISELISRWTAEIHAHNQSGHTDINRHSEDVAMEMLNALYRLNARNLNQNHLNTPAVDLADPVLGVAWQVTSKLDAEKTTETETRFKNHRLEEQFPNGYRFIWLSNQPEKKAVKNKNPPDITPRFEGDQFILSLGDWVQRLNWLYTHDRPRFDAALAILEREFSDKPAPPRRLRRFLLSLAAALFVLTLAWFVYQIWLADQPPMVEVMAENTENNRSLPIKKARFTLIYPDQSSDSLDADGDSGARSWCVIFKNILPQYRGGDIAVKFESEGFITEEKTFPLDRPFQHVFRLKVRRDNSYATLTGLVRDETTGALLSGVTVSIGELSDVTRADGRYKILIPLEKQKQEQAIRAVKTGYREYTRSNTPVIEGVDEPIPMNPD